MKALLSIALCILCLCATAPRSSAQKGGPRDAARPQPPPAEKAPKPRPGQAKAPEKAEKAEMTEQQQHALWLLGVVEGKARKLDPGALQVEILSEVADTLWPFDEARARSLFAEAFAAIDSIKLDPGKDARARLAADGAPDPVVALRAEVLRTVAARDHKLAEKLRQGVREPEGAPGPSEKEELAWDIAVASAGTQPERSAQFVREQLRKGVGESLGAALSGIRLENPQLADQLFAEALAAARASLHTPETLETLAAYVLPSEQELHGRTPAADRDAAARRNFLRYAAERLAAQSAAGHAPAPQSAEAQHEYRLLQSLLPLFEGLAPDKLPLVRERMAVLRSAMSPRQADALTPREQDVSELLRQAEATAGSRRRDARLMQVSMIAARQGELDRAFSIAEKIEDPEERAIQISLLAYQGSTKALAKGDTEGAYVLARRIDFLPQRVAAFNRMAGRLRASKEEARARVLLEEVWEFSVKTPDGSQKAKALLTLTSAVTPHDPERAFAFLDSAVRAIGDADFSAPASSSSRVAPVTVETLNLGAVFAALARVDFDRAMHAAQSIKHPEAALLAQAAVCRQALASQRGLQARKSDPTN